MAKKDNFNNNDPISKAVDLLLENTECCSFKEENYIKELRCRKDVEFWNTKLVGHEKNQRSNSDNIRNGYNFKINNSTR